MKFFNLKILVVPLIISMNMSVAQNSDFDKMVDTLIQKTIPVIDAKELFHEIKYKVPMVLVDAREDIEYAVSHIDKAILVGYEKFDIHKLDGIEKTDKIVVYCSLGYRSEKIAEKLKQNGYANVYNLYGGIFSWVNQGYPIVSKEKKTRNIHPFDEEWGKWLEKGNRTYE